ncbi:MAG: DUF1275 domain-containing protein [Chitinophagaceae bacterium]|nr:DUF1275 domain-containing protein [Rubrivivax sp.]
MPISYARRLIGPQRTPRADRQLSLALAFVAGAINAGGFVAVQQYTSHMTGIVSAMADNVAVGAHALVWAGAGALLSFLSGAACSAMMVHFARRRQLRSEYALPLLLEAVLLLVFGILGAWLSTIEGPFIPVTVMLLCFVMGLQNAVITKLSRAEIRTTHITGVVTDIGIELGKLLYWNGPRPAARPPVTANAERLRTLALLATCFFTGGVIGALGFTHVGYLSTVPLAVLLIALAGVPAADDLLGWLRRRLEN